MGRYRSDDRWIRYPLYFDRLIRVKNNFLPFTLIRLFAIWATDLKGVDKRWHNEDAGPFIELSNLRKRRYPMKLLFTSVILTIFSIFVITTSASAFAVPKGQYKITCYKDNQGWIQQATQQICIQSDGGLSGAWYSSTFQNWRGEWFRKGWSNRVRLWEIIATVMGTIVWK